MLCDEIYILNEGKIIEGGTPDELRKKIAPISKIKIKFKELPKDISVFEKLQVEHEVSSANNLIIFFSKDPMNDFSKIHDFLSTLELNVEKLEISSASLEEIFLKIIGDM